VAGFAVTVGAGRTGAGATSVAVLGGAAGANSDAAGAGSGWVNASNANTPTTLSAVTDTTTARPLATHPPFHVGDETAGSGTGPAWGANVIWGRWIVGAWGLTFGET